MNALVLSIGAQLAKTQAAGATAKQTDNRMPDFAAALNASKASKNASAVAPGAPSSQEAQTQQPGSINDSKEIKPEDEGVIFYPAMLSMLLPFLMPQNTEVTDETLQQPLEAIGNAPQIGDALTGAADIIGAIENAVDDIPVTDQKNADAPAQSHGNSRLEGDPNLGAIAAPIQRAAQDRSFAEFSGGKSDADRGGYSQAFPMTGAMLADNRVVVAAEPSVEAPAPSVPTQVVNSIHMAVSEGRQECEIQLQPEHLGRLVVKLVMTEGGLSARIDAADSSVRAMLNGQISDLKDALAQRGIRVAELDVTYQTQMQTNAQPNFANQNESGAHREKLNYIRMVREPEGMEAPAASIPNIGQDLDAPGVVVNA